MICGNAPALVIQSRAPLSAKEVMELSRVIHAMGVKLLCRKCYEQGRCGDLKFIPVKLKKGDKNGNVQECGMQKN
jgi:hypothetical protein